MAEPSRRTEGDEKLRVIRVLGAVVCAGDQPSVGEPQPLMYLVLERFCVNMQRVSPSIQNRVNWVARTSVDGFATSTCAGPITGLNEEVWDDPVSSHGGRINLGCWKDDRGSTLAPVFPMKMKWVPTGGISPRRSSLAVANADENRGAGTGA